jgi:hypothetical protein
MHGPILLCGNDPALLLTREMLLTHAGFVVSISSESDIVSLPQESAIVLAVLGHSKSAEQQIRTAKLVRLKWPDASILFLREADISLSTVSKHEYESGSRNPVHLIQAGRQILESSA